MYIGIFLDNSLVVAEFIFASSEFTPDKNQLVSPLYLSWNTLESMVLRWKEAIQVINPKFLEPEYSYSS
jgi:hypothetical protein